MSSQPKEIVLDTDKGSFVLLVIATVFVFFSLARDVYRWSQGSWAVPIKPPTGFVDWFSFVMGTLTMVWFVAAFRDPSIRPLRLGCGLVLVSFLIKGSVFLLAPSSHFANVLTYARPVFSAVALVLMLIWLVSEFKRISVHA